MIFTYISECESIGSHIVQIEAAFEHEARKIWSAIILKWAMVNPSPQCISEVMEERCQPKNNCINVGWFDLLLEDKQGGQVFIPVLVVVTLPHSLQKVLSPFEEVETKGFFETP